VAAIAMASTAVLATTYTNGSITLDVPSYPVSAPLYHCEPQNDATADDITVSGIPTGSTVRLNFILSSGVAGDPITNVSQTFTNQSGTVNYTIPYPEDTSTWPYQDATSRAVQVSVAVAVTTNGVTTKVNARPWKVVCKPDVPDNGDPAGCTPGYWGRVGEPWFNPNADQHLDSWPPTGYAPGDNFESVFGVDASFTQLDLGYVVNTGGGGELAMARHAVAALLNAAHPDVNYPLTVNQVLAEVLNAYTTGNFTPAHTLFEGYNEIGCSIN